jgi:uncharacterized protein (TIGR03067 family)
MRRCLLLAAVVLVLPGTRAGGAADEAPCDPDLRKLQGKWELVYHETAGVDDTKELKWTMEVRGDRYTLAVEGQELPGRIRVDSTAPLKRLDYATEELNGDLLEFVGVYELTGDTLKTCDVAKGKPRPTALKTSDPTGQVAVWKRVKVKD